MQATSERQMLEPKEPWAGPVVKNPSGLEPLGFAVLVEPYEPELNSTPLVIPLSARERSSVLEQRVRVIAVGPMAWSDETAPRAVPGDLVLVTKAAGHMAVGVADGKQYRLINDRDVFCRIGRVA